MFPCQKDHPFPSIGLLGQQFLWDMCSHYIFARASFEHFVFPIFYFDFNIQKIGTMAIEINGVIMACQIAWRRSSNAQFFGEMCHKVSQYFCNGSNPLHHQVCWTLGDLLKIADQFYCHIVSLHQSVQLCKIGVPYGGQVVKLHVSLMVGRGLFPHTGCSLAPWHT